jgi:hypothetical protein
VSEEFSQSKIDELPLRSFGTVLRSFDGRQKLRNRDDVADILGADHYALTRDVREWGE